MSDSTLDGWPGNCTVLDKYVSAPASLTSVRQVSAMLQGLALHAGQQDIANHPV